MSGNIKICPLCRCRVWATQDGVCPSCRQRPDSWESAAAAEGTSLSPSARAEASLGMAPGFTPQETVEMTGAVDGSLLLGGRPPQREPGMERELQEPNRQSPSFKSPEPVARTGDVVGATAWVAVWVGSMGFLDAAIAMSYTNGGRYGETESGCTHISRLVVVGLVLFIAAVLPFNSARAFDSLIAVFLTRPVLRVTLATIALAVTVNLGAFAGILYAGCFLDHPSIHGLLGGTCVLLAAFCLGRWFFFIALGDPDTLAHARKNYSHD